MESTLLPDDLVNSPSYQLWLASNAWVRWLKKALVPFEITHVQFAVLAAIARLSETQPHVSQAQVSRFTVMDENMISQVIRHLELRGLVARSLDPNDRRARVLILSSDGKKLCDDARREVNRAAGKFFKEFSAEERVRLAQTLHSLAGQDLG
jgi:DNA-binding MarR family transcriptional regulator